MIVNDFKNWHKIIFNDRTILRIDTQYMSSDQKHSLENLPVKEMRKQKNKIVLYV